MSEEAEVACQRALAEKVLGHPVSPILKAAIKGDLVDRIKRAIATLKHGSEGEVRVELDRLEGLIGQWRACDEDMGR